MIKGVRKPMTVRVEPSPMPRNLHRPSCRLDQPTSPVLCRASHWSDCKHRCRRSCWGRCQLSGVISASAKGILLCHSRPCKSRCGTTPAASSSIPRRTHYKQRPFLRNARRLTASDYVARGRVSAYALRLRKSCADARNLQRLPRCSLLSGD